MQSFMYLYSATFFPIMILFHTSYERISRDTLWENGTIALNIVLSGISIKKPATFLLETVLYSYPFSDDHFGLFGTSIYLLHVLSLKLSKFSGSTFDLL